MVTKKGQGLSLNVIIIAALALIVLVVLVMVFTGRIGLFQQGLSKEGKTELISFRVGYGDCQPTATAEASFDTEFSAATSLDAKDQVKIRFSSEVSRCKAIVEKGNCESAGCKWP
ncbi:TPA: hypothetical protein HA242_03800 [Candidatus Woesearchaeota archaeon]|nr:hypothetical protein [Candidatus Woesearchaeota archaeon]HIH12820.1 hypothetical protein [Candidatus Woesearchaeota archaeon]